MSQRHYDFVIQSAARGLKLGCGLHFYFSLINGCEKRALKPIVKRYQCSKLTVHSAPGAHISAAGRTFFGRVHPMCAHFPT